MKPVVVGVVLIAAIVTLPLLGAYVLQPQLAQPEPADRSWAPDPPPDEAVMKSDRFGRNLIACRQLRREELRLAGKEAEGIEYFDALHKPDGLFATIRDMNAAGPSRAIQADMLKEELGRCAVGAEVATLYGVEVMALGGLDYAGVPIEVLMARAEKKMAATAGAAR